MLRGQWEGAVGDAGWAGVAECSVAARSNR